jgi:hypothetical protein
MPARASEYSAPSPWSGPVGRGSVRMSPCIPATIFFRPSNEIGEGEGPVLDRAMEAAGVG